MPDENSDVVGGSDLTAAIGSASAKVQIGAKIFSYLKDKLFQAKLKKDIEQAKILYALQKRAFDAGGLLSSPSFSELDDVTKFHNQFFGEALDRFPPLLVVDEENKIVTGSLLEGQQRDAIIKLLSRAVTTNSSHEAFSKKTLCYFR